jgi:hypothetical protein
MLMAHLGDSVSMSTLGSLLALCLEQFPSVPNYIPKKQKLANLVSPSTSRWELGPMLEKNSFVSNPSLSTLSSLPTSASVNLLEIQLDDYLCRGRGAVQPKRCLLSWSSLLNPGELWDEEDERLLSVSQTPWANEDEYRRLLVPDSRSRRRPACRNTWSPAPSCDLFYDKGELWDADDDRRYSLPEDGMTLRGYPTFVSLCFVDLLAGLPDSNIILHSLTSFEDLVSRAACFGEDDELDTTATATASLSSTGGEEQAHSFATQTRTALCFARPKPYARSVDHHLESSGGFAFLPKEMKGDDGGGGGGGGGDGGHHPVTLEDASHEASCEVKKKKCCFYLFKDLFAPALPAVHAFFIFIFIFIFLFCSSGWLIGLKLHCSVSGLGRRVD